MKRSSGFTLIELLVVITIIGILASISIPAISGALDKAKLTKAAANLGGIIKIMAVMQVDEVQGDTNISSYPGTNLDLWYKSLTNYAGTNDLMKLFSAGDVNVTTWTGSGPNTNAFYVYGVSSESEGDSILMTSRNWKAPLTGAGPALVKTDKPFGDKGAIVLKKSHVYGAQIINARQATNAIETIGIATNVLN